MAYTDLIILFKEREKIMYKSSKLFILPILFLLGCENGNSNSKFYSQTVKENNVKENYNPGNDSRFPKEDRDYFNEIVLGREYESSDSGMVCKWTSDINILVKGEKPDYLIDELYRIVEELNDLIDPININIVNHRSDANYIILFGSQKEYNRLAPRSIGDTEDNWGMFIINSGERIFRGTMYVDIYRCESIDGQKHLLREELTQSLGLTNDSYKYDNSIFQQRWTEATEFAPIDRRLIKMLYNYNSKE
jgi:hypothetical protein